ncbi:MAG TPA: hypothetical protein VGE62_00965 [Candidatus Paceibacterota bacterium]
MTLRTKTDVRPDDHEFVTKGYLRNEFKYELKTEIKMDFKGEFDELRMMIWTSIEDNRREHEEMRKDIRGLKEDIARVIDLIHEKTDPIFKYVEGNEKDKARINRRLARLESNAGLA